METMSPSTVTPPRPMTAEEKKLARKASLANALGALDAKRSGSEKQPATPTPIPTPKAPTAKPTTPAAAPKIPREHLPVDDRFGLPLSPRFLEATPREPSAFGRATRI